jgi:hypothetical protein
MRPNEKYLLSREVGLFSYLNEDRQKGKLYITPQGQSLLSQKQHKPQDKGRQQL